METLRDILGIVGLAALISWFAYLWINRSNPEAEKKWEEDKAKDGKYAIDVIKRAGGSIEYHPFMYRFMFGELIQRKLKTSDIRSLQAAKKAIQDHKDDKIIGEETIEL